MSPSLAPSRRADGRPGAVPRAGVALAAASLALAAVAPGSAAAVPAGPYVALGDSYSAGAGVPPFPPGGPLACMRSDQGFGHVVAQRIGAPAFTDATCSGAASQDLTAAQYPGVPAQVDALHPDTALVTLSIGGNDGKVFTSAVAGCIAESVTAGDPAGDPCRRRYGEHFVDRVRGETRTDVEAALRAVRGRAPHARVVVVGYPRILPDTFDPACRATMPISAGDAPFLAGLQHTLTGTIADASAAVGADFVDMTAVSAGHDACAAPGERWIEPVLGFDGAAPVHPNAAGERAMADAVVARLG